MAPRAVWSGVIKIAELACPVKMYTAATTSERIALNMVNRETGNRLKRLYVDEKSGKPVDSDDQVKGYETNDGSYIILEPEEIAAAVPDSDKSLTVEAFIACNRIETTYFDRPYYLLPASDANEESFVLVREAMRKQKVAAIAHAVLFRRLRPVLIRPRDKGLIATTLNFDYEVRSAKQAFKSIGEHKVEPEMLELAQHIIKTKSGKFAPEKFDDRYETALAEMVRAKIAGRKVVPLRRPEPTKKNDLLEALRMSAGNKDTAETKKSTAKKPATKKAADTGKSERRRAS
ncbi:MAG: Ku protein [Devosia sp.]|jgi:DNA end-binding protein Ku|uniref:non-homologous end joining protein Ku n=1 Tax=unclassified Devosia TaxID=196773 RepID=UPI0019F87E78|nr:MULTISPECIES: Ku protein [unclassified Devosia]MBF0678295.1 Ku protein [Devosia sp.]WEJ31549.1 Ku protein [Devosia sp. SD17-2]